jgi:pyruvate/2-oxoglutarate dehydrogenase complex dihydrolipoamide dehydrogenase (E3) component
VTNETITAEKIHIAACGRPVIPELEGLEGSGFTTSDEALRLKKQPKVLTILGGGYTAARWRTFSVRSARR